MNLGLIHGRAMVLMEVTHLVDVQPKDVRLQVVVEILARSLISQHITRFFHMLRQYKPIVKSIRRHRVELLE